MESAGKTEGGGAWGVGIRGRREMQDGRASQTDQRKGTKSAGIGDKIGRNRGQDRQE